MEEGLSLLYLYCNTSYSVSNATLSCHSSVVSITDLTLCYTIMTFKSFPKQQSLDSSKLKEFADDNFKFDKNGRKLSKHVENTVGKGEIACYEQFLFFPQCFQRACFPGASEGVIGGNGLISLKWKHFENIWDKGENAGNQHFLLFPPSFLPFPKQISYFQS